MIARVAAILRHEALMMLRRKAMWLAYGALYVFYGAVLWITARNGRGALSLADGLWASAGLLIFQFNMFMALAAGILAADTLARDHRIGVDELRRSAPTRDWIYVLGKFLGTLSALLAPYLLWVVASGTAVVVTGVAPLVFLPMMLVAFVAMAIPAYVFVIAFSMACPLFMPVRVYQVLFTGYWFWGNYLNPKTFPTLNGTFVTPSGVFVLQGFFGQFKRFPVEPRRESLEAWLNLAVLAATVILLFALLDRYMTWRARRA